MNDKPASPRQVPFWLVLSLMVNMMLVGLLAGLVLRPGPSGPVAREPVERFAWARRDGDNAPIALVLREAFEASEAERQDRVTARKALGEAVARDPYDEEAVRKAFASLRTADEAVNASTHEEMVKLFARLPVDERTHMARILMHGPEGMHPMRRLRPGARIELRREIIEQDGGPAPDPDQPPPPPYEP